MEIEERVGEDVRMAFTQPPQLLMLRENPNPYLFIVSGRYPWRYFIVWSVAGQTGWPGTCYSAMSSATGRGR